MKQFKVRKLFVTHACLHVLHFMYLYMSSLCCSQDRQDLFVVSKLMCQSQRKTWACYTYVCIRVYQKVSVAVAGRLKRGGTPRRKGRGCSSSRVQIKDSGLTWGVDDETVAILSCQIILQGSLEEIKIKRETLLFNSFCFQSWFPLISRVRESCLTVRVGSFLEQWLVIEPIPL